MVILYMASHFLAEPIFVVATVFASLFPFIVLIFLQFGTCGKVISASKRTRRFLHGGVISGDYRDMYYKKCIKHAPPALRTAYRGFLLGEVSVCAFAEGVSASIKERRKLFMTLYNGATSSLTLLVFLMFYFTCSFSETMLRAVITAFVSLSNGTVLRLLLYVYAASAKKSAVKLSEMLDKRLLREKKDIQITLEDEKEREDRAQTSRLREMLRELEESAIR